MDSGDLTAAQVADALAQQRRAVKDAEALAERQRELKTKIKRPASPPDPDLAPELPRARLVPGGGHNTNYRVTVDGQELLLHSPAPLDAFHLDRDAYPHPKCPPETRCLYQIDVFGHFRDMDWSPRARYADPDRKFDLRDFETGVEFPGIVDNEHEYFRTSEKWVAAVSEQLPRIWEERDANPWHGPMPGNQPSDVAEQFAAVSGRLKFIIDFYEPRVPGLLAAAGLTDTVLHRVQDRPLPSRARRSACTTRTFTPGRWVLKPDGGLLVVDEEWAAPGSSVYDMTTFLLNDHIGMRYPEMNDRLLDARSRTERDWFEAFAPLVAARSAVTWSTYLVRQLRARSFVDPASRGEPEAAHGRSSWDKDVAQAAKTLNRVFTESQRYIPELVAGPEQVRDLLDAFLARPRAVTFTVKGLSVGADGPQGPDERPKFHASLRPTVAPRSESDPALPEFPAAAAYGFAPVSTWPDRVTPATRGSRRPEGEPPPHGDLAATVAAADKAVGKLAYKGQIRNLTVKPWILRKINGLALEP
ncbi:hypothetical protein ACU686_24985 [Yinghuangia aomiensis]